CLHREGPERDGARADGSTERRQCICDPVVDGNRRVGGRMAGPSDSASRAATNIKWTKISAARRRDSHALDRSVDPDAEQADRLGGDSDDLSQPAISAADLVS